MKTIFGVLFSIMLIIVNVDPASLVPSNQEWCKTNGKWVFGIGGVDEQNAPLVIQATWENGAEEVIPLTRTYNGFAFYETTSNLESLVTGAIAKLPESWTGKFNLICNRPTGVSLVTFTAKSTIGYYDKIMMAVSVVVIALAWLLVGWRRGL